MRWFVCAVALSTTVMAQDNWLVQNPLPSPNTLSAVHFLSPTHGFVTDGALKSTTDGGNTWVTHTSCRNTGKVNFLDANIGHAMGDLCMMWTENGGVNWRTRSVPFNAENQHFPTHDTGYAIGYNFVMRTYDGGNNWIRTDLSGTWTGLYFPKPDTGYLTGSGGRVYKTVDAGQTWNQTTPPPLRSYYDIRFMNANKGFAVGSGGIIIRTFNGGLSWDSLASGTSAALRSIAFLGGDSIIAVGDLGTVVGSINGGTTWSQQVSKVNQQLDGVHFPTPLVGYASGVNGTFIKTVDGGVNWIVRNPITRNFLAVHFPDTANGFAVGDSGVIFRTTNGGATWASVGSQSRHLRGVYFVDKQIGFAVGDSGLILRTANAGGLWTAINSGTTSSLRAVHFPTPQVGYAVGGAVTLKSVDGGVSWSVIRTYGGLAVHFVNKDTGFVTGSGSNLTDSWGVIYRTLDGGASWAGRTFSYSHPVNALHFPTPLVGYASRQIGEFYRTVDGGVTWKQVSGYGPSDIHFIDAARGFGVESGGRIQKTLDSGKTWLPVSSGVLSSLTAIHFPSSTTGFIVGERGTILKALADPSLTVPSLLSPAHLATGIRKGSSVSWQLSPGAISYTLQIYSGNSLVWSEGEIQGTSKVIPVFSPSTTYDWCVSSTYPAGISEKSALWRYTTQGIPSQPRTILPKDSSTNLPNRVMLSWNRANLAESYTVQVATDSFFTSLIVFDSTLSDTLFLTPALPPGAIYYWRVAAGNSTGRGYWTGRRRFTTALPPAAPTLLLPGNGALEVAIASTLVWNLGIGLTSYRLQLASDSLFTALLLEDSTLTSTARPVGPLLYNSTYYWRIRGTSSEGYASPWSEVWKFTTALPPAPGVPTLIAPSDGALELPVTQGLTWAPVIGTSMYRVQVSGTKDFSALIRDTLLVDSTLILNGLENNKQYYWRVSARNAGGDGAWSAVRNFTTIIALPGPITLDFPGPADIVTTDSVRLAWRAGGLALKGYLLEFGVDSTFAKPQVSQSLLDTFHIVSGMQNGMVHYWRVRGENAAGMGPFSTKAYFLVRLPTVNVVPMDFTLQYAGPGTGNSIRFGLAKQAHVTAKLFDTRGRLVQTLIDENKQPGYYSLKTRVPGGRYTLRFVAGEFRKTISFIQP